VLASVPRKHGHYAAALWNEDESVNDDMINALYDKVFEGNGSLKKEFMGHRNTTEMDYDANKKRATHKRNEMSEKKRKIKEHTAKFVTAHQHKEGKSKKTKKSVAFNV